MCGSEIVPELLNFWRRSTTFQICSKRSKLVTNHECTAITLKPKPNHSNGSVQKSSSSSVKCEDFAYIYRYFRHETCGSEDYSKIVKIWAKPTWQETLTMFNDVPDLLKRWLVMNHGSKAITLKKVHQVRSNVKVLLTIFFDYNGVVQYEFLPQGLTINKEYYLEVICWLREGIR